MSFEPGQRVTVLTYDGRVIGDGVVADMRPAVGFECMRDAYKANPTVTWVRMTVSGETSTQEWPNERILVRS